MSGSFLLDQIDRVRGGAALGIGKQAWAEKRCTFVSALFFVCFGWSVTIICGGIVGESEFAKQLRREAEAQTALAEATYKEGIASRTYAERAAASNAEVAISAKNTEEYTARLLNAQLEQNEAVKAHNFAVWRQDTLRGQEYERWREEADPAITEFVLRCDEWEASKAEDIAAMRSRLTEQSKDLFKLNSRLFRISYTVAGNLPVWPYIAGSALLGFVLMVIALMMQFESPLSLLWVTPVLFVARLLVDPLMTVHQKRLARSREWVAGEVSAFTAALPQVWATESDWQVMSRVNSVVTSMPSNYLNYRSDMLVAIPTGQPAPLHDDVLPAEAVQARALLDSWRNQ